MDHTHEAYQEVAKSLGLTRYPSPDGERYVYNLAGECVGKKNENIDFIDELWQVLVGEGPDASEDGLDEQDEED